MNKERRMKLVEAESLLDRAKDIVEDVQSEEEDVLSNLEENFSGTDRYAQIESNVENLQELQDTIDEAIDQIQSIED